MANLPSLPHINLIGVKQYLLTVRNSCTNTVVTAALEHLLPFTTMPVGCCWTMSYLEEFLTQNKAHVNGSLKAELAIVAVKPTDLYFTYAKAYLVERLYNSILAELYELKVQGRQNKPLVVGIGSLPELISEVPPAVLVDTRNLLVKEGFKCSFGTTYAASFTVNL